MESISPAARLRGVLTSPLLPIWALPALLPFGRSAEVVIVLCLIGCLFLFARHPRALAEHPGARLFVALCACYGLAALVSAIDAVAPGKSWGTVASALRFFPLGLYAAFAMRRAATVRPVETGVAIVVTFWLADAWLQAITGHSLGGAAEAERLSGVFGADNLKFGPVLATLSPFVLQAARQRWGRRGLLLAIVITLVPVLLSGSRASWLVFGLVGTAFLWRETASRWRFFAWTGGLALFALAAGFVGWRTSEAFAARVDRTLLLFSGSTEAVDRALAGRLRIWQTAESMIAAHPLNGVGVRGFRYAYATHAQPGDAFIYPGSPGAAHAHHWVLEVLSETGAAGLALWLLALALAWRAWHRADAAARERAFTPAVALAAMLFPLNTHLAFYSAWWGLLFWWLVALYCAALYAMPDTTRNRDA
ncbi:O-antigen ligase family protein [Tahibacter amnicola]|uniref:O-antigen ligase family protein n=1 Tax=Tahibacter amnicola TaxID=2976241 RepID=A0ABY6BGW1_9GAMM|nr:O-antigen ligase family protein [Tahibacter amnicola]UXI69017.1 O-antigen ligase family protein [Tahibacter amnicola]